MNEAFLQQVEHRPWPLPEQPWNFYQEWRQLLFAHYRLDPSVLRPLIPAPLELETFDGVAWIGVVPFFLVARPRRVPAVPRLSFFPEINVRTYVRYAGQPGVWFFSLDARNPLAVWAARRFFHLPYYHAAMKMDQRNSEVHYRSRRYDETCGRAEFVGNYRPVGDVQLPQPGSLEHFLAERYCLFTTKPKPRSHSDSPADSELVRVDVHHAPWPLQTATAEIERNSMTAPLGVSLPDEPPLLHYAEGVQVAVWPLEVIEQTN